jgi:hypothetical protein
MADRRGEAVLAALNGVAGGFAKAMEQREARKIEERKLSMLEQEAALTKEAKELEIGSARRQQVESERQNLRKQKGQIVDSPESDQARRAYAHYGLKVNPSDTEESLHLAYGPLGTFAKTRFEEEEKRKTEKEKGKADPLKDIKEHQWKAAGFARQMERAEETLSQLLPGYGRSDRSEILTSALPSQLRPGTRKAIDQAESEFAMAVLRDESGATITKDELHQKKETLFEREGDDARSKAQKRAAREQAVKNMMAKAGKALGHVPGVAAPKAQKGKGAGVPFVQDAEASGGPPPGSVVRVGGKRYRVAEDGDTLEPL